MSLISDDENPLLTAKVVEYLESSMAGELLSKFPDNSAFDFDYSQSSIWSPLVPRPLAAVCRGGGGMDISRKLSYEENDESVLRLLKNSKKIAAHVRRKLGDVVLDKLCGYTKMRKMKRNSFGVSQVHSSGCLAASSPTPRKGWGRAIKAAGKHFKKRKMRRKDHILPDFPGYSAAAAAQGGN